MPVTLRNARAAGGVTGKRPGVRRFEPCRRCTTNVHKARSDGFGPPRSPLSGALNGKTPQSAGFCFLRANAEPSLEAEFKRNWLRWLEWSGRTGWAFTLLPGCHAITGKVSDVVVP
jgi:hypothetical protein